MPNGDAARTAASAAAGAAASAVSSGSSSRAPGFARARAYVFNRDPKVRPCDAIVREDGTLCPSAQLPGTLLSEEQAAHVIAVFEGPPRGLDTAPWCFDPHHGVVLYDDADVAVAAMSICFERERQDLWLREGHAGARGTPLSVRALTEFDKVFCGELGMTPCGGRR
ncbi:MAG: hypothetical protein R3F14_06245 [Polyangiaceae bacterium]